MTMTREEIENVVEEFESYIDNKPVRYGDRKLRADMRKLEALALEALDAGGWSADFKELKRLHPSWHVNFCDPRSENDDEDHFPILATVTIWSKENYDGGKPIGIAAVEYHEGGASTYAYRLDMPLPQPPESETG